MQNKKTATLVRLSVLAGIILLMAFTPLGYFRTAGLEITFITIPVVLGAMLLGPGGGAVLGAVFGATSFIQCFGISPFGAMLLGINPLFSFITCMVPRVLMGWLTGLIYKALSAPSGDSGAVEDGEAAKKGWRERLSVPVTGLAGPLLNTVLFMTSLMLCFGNTPEIRNLMGDMSVLPFVVAFVGINGLVEALVCFVVASIIGRVAVRFFADH